MVKACLTVNGLDDDYECKPLRYLKKVSWPIQIWKRRLKAILASQGAIIFNLRCSQLPLAEIRKELSNRWGLENLYRYIFSQYSQIRSSKSDRWLCLCAGGNRTLVVKKVTVAWKARAWTLLGCTCTVLGARKYFSIYVGRSVQRIEDIWRKCTENTSKK